MIQQTFVIIKPDAIQRGLIGKIISRFEDKQLDILEIGMRVKNTCWCKQHYRNIDEYEILNRLYFFMTNTPLIGITLYGEEAIQIVRGMVGRTNSTLAAVGTIRGDYGGLPVHENLVHASSDVDAAAYERRLFFNE